MLSHQKKGIRRKSSRLDSHEVDLGQHPDRPRPLRIHISGHLQPIRIRQIRIRRRHSQDDRIRLADEFQQHLPDLPLDVPRLIPHGDLCQPGQIDQGQGEDVGGKDAQVDRVRGDAGVLPRHLFGIPDDLVPDLGKVVEFLVGKVKEFTPFVLVVGVGAFL